MPRLVNSVSQTIPAPVGGWNDRDPIDAMPDTDAITLENYYPFPGAISLRKGYAAFATTNAGNAVKTLKSFFSQSGTNQLIAFAGTKAYSVSTAGSVTEITNAKTITSAIWYPAIFRSTAGGATRMVLVNGVDEPLFWDGTTLTQSDPTDAAPSYTNANLADDSQLVFPCSHNNRLYFAKIDSSAYYYGATNAYTGALTEVDITGIFQQGGYILWMSSWARDLGNSSLKLFVICSNLGEVLVYSGTDPGNADWVLVGRSNIGSPLGRRSFLNLNNDIYIITTQGVIMLSEVINNPSPEAPVNALTDKIQNTFNQNAFDYGSNFGWQLVPYRAISALYVNVPIVESTQIEQYVMNLITGAWCNFKGMNGICFEVFNNRLYFGTSAGTIKRADYGSSDNSTDLITAKVKTASNYLGDRSRNKIFKLVAPVMDVSYGTSYGLGVDVDGEDSALDSQVTTSLGVMTPWGSPWGSAWESALSFVKDWRAIDGYGRSCAVKMEGAYKNTTMKISSFQILYERAGGI